MSLSYGACTFLIPVVDPLGLCFFFYNVAWHEGSPCEPL